MTLPDHNEADDYDHRDDDAPDAFLPKAERDALDKFDAELDLEPDEDEDEFKDEAAAQPSASAELAAIDAELNAPTFYEAGSDLHALDDLDMAGRVSVLERLGPAHFRSRGFSFMGFLQTVYDHVAEQLKRDAVNGVGVTEVVAGSDVVTDTETLATASSASKTAYEPTATEFPAPGDRASDPGEPLPESPTTPAGE